MLFAVCFAIVVGFFLTVSTIFAGDPPLQTTPTNNSSVNSSTLNWQTPLYSLYSSNPYRVQIDDDSGFTSINKDYYTDNTHYSPVLDYGTWYWKIKAKDSTGSWSDWSSVWGFTLSATSSSPLSPTPSPTPTSTPTPTPSSTPSSSSFTISNSPSQIDSTQTFNISVNLNLPSSPNEKFYLKGAFKKVDSSNYFGQTKVGSSWVKNGSSFSNQFPLTTGSNGIWSGNLEIQADVLDSGYEGSGDYIFKVARYSSSGSGPTWSSEVNIKILAKEIETEDNIPSLSKLAVKSQVSVKGVSKEEKKLEAKSSYSLENYRKTSTPSATPNPTNTSTNIKSDKQINLPLILGSVLSVGGLGSIVYILWKNKVKSIA